MPEKICCYVLLEGIHFFATSIWLIAQVDNYRLDEKYIDVYYQYCLMSFKQIK